MEESGQTIREESPAPVEPTPRAWLCDGDDRPVTEYVGDDAGNFRIKIGRLWYERFHVTPGGDHRYRVVK